MRPDQEASVDTAARLLGLMVARRGRVVGADVRILDEHDAFGRLGMSRNRFLQLAELALADLDIAHFDCSWLQARDQAYVDRLLDAISDTRQRELICRLAAAVVMADGTPAHDDRPVYHHVLSRWRIDQSTLVEALA